MDKYISKIESGSLPGNGDLYFYNPTKITQLTPVMINILSTIHKVDTALFKYLVDKKICLL